MNMKYAQFWDVWSGICPSKMKWLTIVQPQEDWKDCSQRDHIFETEMKNSVLLNQDSFTLLQCFSGGLFSLFWFSSRFQSENMKSTKGNLPPLPHLAFSSNPNIRSPACWWEWIYTCSAIQQIESTSARFDSLHFISKTFDQNWAELHIDVKLCKSKVWINV